MTQPESPNSTPTNAKPATASWSETWGGYGLAAVALAYFASPILKIADARFLLVIGVGLAFGIVFWFDAWIAKGRAARELTIIGAIGIIIAFITALSQLSAVVWADSANNRRCQAIQNDMQSAHRRLENGPEMFQAFGCHPQGQRMFSVKPTDREIKAGHALKDGGYSY